MARYLPAAMFTILLHLTLFILYQLLYFPTHSHPKATTATPMPILTQSHADRDPIKHTEHSRDFQQRFDRFDLDEEETFDLIDKYLPNQKAFAMKEDDINANTVDELPANIDETIDEILAKLDSPNSSLTNLPIKIVKKEEYALNYSNNGNFGSLLTSIIISIIISVSLMYAVTHWNKMQQHIEAESMDNIEEEEVTAPQTNSIMINQLTQESSIEEELDEWKALKSILRAKPMTIDQRFNYVQNNIEEQVSQLIPHAAQTKPYSEFSTNSIRHGINLCKYHKILTQESSNMESITMCQSNQVPSKQIAASNFSDMEYF